MREWFDEFKADNLDEIAKRILIKNTFTALEVILIDKKFGYNKRSQSCYYYDPNTEARCAVGAMLDEEDVKNYAAENGGIMALISFMERNNDIKNLKRLFGPHYFSSFVRRTMSDYYSLLQSAHDTAATLEIQPELRSHEFLYKYMHFVAKVSSCLAKLNASIDLDMLNPCIQICVLKETDPAYVKSIFKYLRSPYDPAS